jgi:hypothetical protein
MGTAILLPLLFAYIVMLRGELDLQNILEFLGQSLVFACSTNPHTNYSCFEFCFHNKQS